MPEKALRLERGDSLALPNGDGSRHLWRVDRRLRGGYVLASAIGEPDRFWTHDEIFDAYVAGELEHWPCNLAALDPALAAMLQTDLDSWPPRKVFEARCREIYVMRADALRARGVSAKVAYRRAAGAVSRAYKVLWAREADRLDAAEKAIARAIGRKPVSTAMISAAPIVPFCLGEFSVRNWYLQWEKSGRDIRGLLAKDHLRGDHRPRKTRRVDEQTDDRSPLCVYGAMAWIGRSVWMQVPRVTKTYAYKRLNELCESRGFDKVSDTTFFTFLDTYFTEFEEFRARFGPRAAYLKYHIFERRELPSRALEEVEVDHCLLDVFVTDQRGRKARPWLTVLICRATKMIVGFHLSFEVPSYASLSRAVIHAMAPKDLSALPEIQNDWPCHGVFDMLITDRGLEFLSESFRRAGGDLKFAIVNLPGRMPHLKGTVERFFGGLGIRVLTHLEGTTLSRTDQYYDPQARARFTLAELTAKLVKWVVDDYHQTEHGSLGVSPAHRWKELVEDDEVNGGVRPVGNFSRLVMLMGERVRRKISNVGIHFDNNIYASASLAQLRKRRGGLANDVEILADVTDRGHLWVLDKVGKRWFVVPAVNQRISRGLNKYASRVVMRMARKIAGKGAEITDVIMQEARERCEAEALVAQNRKALRFCSDGALATNLVGNNGILAVLTGAVEPPPRVDDDQEYLFPELITLPPHLPTPAIDRTDEGSALAEAVELIAAETTDAVVAAGKKAGADACEQSSAADSASELRGMEALRSLVAMRADNRRVLK